MNPRHFQQVDGMYYVSDFYDVDGDGWVTLQELLQLLGNDEPEKKSIAEFKFLQNN